MALGATLIAEEEVSVSTGAPIEDNLYVAGGMVTVGDVIVGDLLIAGGQIMVTEDVTEDLTAAGGNLTVLGNIGGDVRIAGGSILITGTVAGDLVAAGGSLVLAPGVTVGKDLILAGGQISVDADVAGDVELTGGIATLNGQIQGDVIARMEDRLTLGSGAVIEGNLEYHGPREDALTITDGAIITGEVTFVQRKGFDQAETEATLAAIAGGFMVFKLLASLVTALILALIFKRFTTSVALQVVRTPLKLLGLGFVTLVVVPVAFIVLLVTLLGMPLAFLTLLAYIFLLLLSGALGGIVVGAWLSQLVYKSPDIVVTWKNVSVGVLVLGIVGWIPVVGWIVSCGIFLATLGSIVMLMHNKLWLTR